MSSNKETMESSKQNPKIIFQSLLSISSNRKITDVENKISGEVAGHIEDIVVDSEVRGKMIGVSLIKELIKVAKNKGCYRITLFCKETMNSWLALRFG